MLLEKCNIYQGIANTTTDVANEEIKFPNLGHRVIFSVG
jgi:hypothetical protein